MKKSNKNLLLFISYLAKVEDRRKTGCLMAYAASLLGLSQDVRRKTVIFQKLAPISFKKKNTYMSYVLHLKKTLQPAPALGKDVRQARLTSLARIQYWRGLRCKADVRQAPNKLSYTLKTI